jgi:hypothetical protein
MSHMGHGIVNRQGPFVRSHALPGLPALPGVGLGRCGLGAFLLPGMRQFSFWGRAVQVAVRVSGVLQGEGEVRSVAGTR